MARIATRGRPTPVTTYEEQFLGWVLQIRPDGTFHAAKPGELPIKATSVLGLKKKVRNHAKTVTRLTAPLVVYNISYGGTLEITKVVGATVDRRGRPRLIIQDEDGVTSISSEAYWGNYISAPANEVEIIAEKVKRLNEEMDRLTNEREALLEPLRHRTISCSGILTQVRQQLENQTPEQEPLEITAQTTWA